MVWPCNKPLVSHPSPPTGQSGHAPGQVTAIHFPESDSPPVNTLLPLLSHPLTPTAPFPVTTRPFSPLLSLSFPSASPCSLPHHPPFPPTHPTSSPLTSPFLSHCHPPSHALPHPPFIKYGHPLIAKLIRICINLPDGQIFIMNKLRKVKENKERSTAALFFFFMPGKDHEHLYDRCDENEREKFRRSAQVVDKK